MTVAAILVLGTGVLSPAHGGAPAASGEKVLVVVTFPDGQQMAGSLISGTKTGSITITTSHGEQTFARKDWKSVDAKNRLLEFADAETLFRNRKYKAAAAKYDEAYVAYEHLYAFGDDALDGKARALIGLKNYKAALATYKQLFKEYSGASLTHARRYWYAVCLGNVGGAANSEAAIAQLDTIIAATDNVLTVRALNQAGRIHYGNKDHYLALRSYLQVCILYQNFQGAGAQDTQALVAAARTKAIECCDELMKTDMKKRIEKIRTWLVAQ